MKELKWCAVVEDDLMAEERIMTQHPEGKQGVNISRAKYEAVREAILAALAEQEPQTFRGLQAAVEERLRGGFEGSIGWYYTTVKLDLEARGEIERVPGASPQELRRVGGSTEGAK